MDTKLRNKAIYEAFTSGRMTQKQIAAELHLSTPRVHQIIRGVRRYGDRIPNPKQNLFGLNARSALLSAFRLGWDDQIADIDLARRASRLTIQELRKLPRIGTKGICEIVCCLDASNPWTISRTPEQPEFSIPAPGNPSATTHPWAPDGD